jgi:hypothetical protein
VNKKKLVSLVVFVLLCGCAGKTIKQVYDYQGWEWQKDCQKNLRSLHSGLLIYSTDYDDKFPTADWDTTIFPYVKAQQSYTCPALYEPGTTASGYSMNPALYGKTQNELGDIDKFVVFFESTSAVKGDEADPSTHLTTSRHAGSIYQVYLSGYVEDLETLP